VRVTPLPRSDDVWRALQALPAIPEDTGTCLGDAPVDLYGHAWAMLVDGAPIAVGGIEPDEGDAAEAWLVPGADLRPYAADLIRSVRVALSRAPYRRITAHVMTDGFARGHRFALSLGFSLVNPRVPCYHPSGADMSLYVLKKD